MTKMSHKEAYRTAQDMWDYVYLVTEVETKPDAVIRRVEGPLADLYGQPIVQQFKVNLYSMTGPVHWLALLKNGQIVKD